MLAAFSNQVGNELHGLGSSSTPRPTVQASESRSSDTKFVPHRARDSSHVSSQANQASSRRVRWFEVGQFFKPRQARNASTRAVSEANLPRSAGSEIQGRGNSTGSPAGKRQGVRPNPSVKPSPNGGPPGPASGYGVHCPLAGPGVPPLVPSYLKR